MTLNLEDLALYVTLFLLISARLVALQADTDLFFPPQSEEMTSEANELRKLFPDFQAEL